MNPGPITSTCLPPEVSEDRSNWVVRAWSLTCQGKLRVDLDEYFRDELEAREFLFSCLATGDLDCAHKVAIGSYHVDRWGGEYLDSCDHYSGESLRLARERAREEKEML